jgi:hypothetical protein
MGYHDRLIEGGHVAVPCPKSVEDACDSLVGDPLRYFKFFNLTSAQSDMIVDTLLPGGR